MDTKKEPIALSSKLWKFRRFAVLYWVLLILSLYLGLTILSFFIILVIHFTSRRFIDYIERFENEQHE